MKRVTLLLAAILSGAFFLSGCQSTTAGGATNSSRSQLLLISSADVNEGAATAYKKELTKARASNALNTNASYTRRVNNVSKRLIAQVGVFRPDALKWNWEVNVLNQQRSERLLHARRKNRGLYRASSAS